MYTLSYYHYQIVLEFAIANGLHVHNSCFKKRHSDLGSYSSGGHSTHLDYKKLSLQKFQQRSQQRENHP